MAKSRKIGLKSSIYSSHTVSRRGENLVIQLVVYVRHVKIGMAD